MYVLFRYHLVCLQGLWILVAGSEGAFGGEVAEAHQGVHEGELPRLVELQTRNASAVGKQRGLGELTKFLAVHKGFQDILLHFQIAVDDAMKPHSQFGKILHRLADAVTSRLAYLK